MARDWDPSNELPGMTCAASFSAVNGPAFPRQTGMVTGFPEPQGGRKTATMRMLLGPVKPDSGR